ncbi:MAG: hypothetical protein DWH97_02335 [Planctomycetota bacterium]|nr:MAG: hypothetical protein DWH97_02335 [Planctomycetota bacterium]
MTKFRPAVGPRLAWLLAAVFCLFALLMVNSAYLASITLLEWFTNETLQNQFYLWNFLAHLVLGFAIVVPTIVFGALHWRNVHNRPNPRAISAGIATFVAAIVLLATGVALTRVELAGTTIGLREPMWRDSAYWIHVIAPLVVAWLFVLHRLSGRRMKWKVGARWTMATAAAAIAAVLGHYAIPSAKPVVPSDGERYFEPSLAKTNTGGFIPAQGLMANEYCLECHQDVVHSWAHSAHAASSFNNPLYTASVRETRQQAFAREGKVNDARFCAGCHDPVPFLSGSFEDPKWDDPAYDVANDPLGRASITCTVCHGIISVDSPRGNADYTLRESPHYPFAFSDSPLLQWASSQLIKAKPSFHKRTFLKDEVHRSSEFCGACHKVFLPEALNDYKWLRGQDHYDSFLYSGRSGHGVLGWYYPEKAATDCNTCHMPAMISDDFAARTRDGSGQRSVLSHAFPSANTALSCVIDMSVGAMLPDSAAYVGEGEVSNETAEQARAAIAAAAAGFNAKTLRLDLFALREGGTIDGALHVIRPSLPTLRAGQTYLLEVVVRTLDIGHEFTQGTADSNEAWLYARASMEGREIGSIGALGTRGALDPWSRTYNAFVIDREGNRIDRRNPQDIFLALFNNQIPPGAGDVTHLLFTVPLEANAPIEIESEVRYRKFDTTYMEFVYGADRVNDLPVMILTRDSITLPVQDRDGVVHGKTTMDARAFPPWQRWYDYGIGLLREADRGAGRGAVRQAEEAFVEVETLVPSVGALAQARLQIREGRLDEAAASLARASTAAAGGAIPSTPWTITYFTALADKQNGNFSAAIEGFQRVLATDFAGARERGFDFSIDTRVLNELAETTLEAARLERGESQRAHVVQLLEQSQQSLRASLKVDPEQAQAWWLLARACDELGQVDEAKVAREQHAKYKLDENARDRAARLAREKYPWADHAAEATVFYDLMRPERFVGGLLPGTRLEVPKVLPPPLTPSASPPPSLAPPSLAPPSLAPPVLGTSSNR